jgi:hypothetical protein
MTNRKHPYPGFWITVALLAVLVGYPVSFGPACWMCEHGFVTARTAWLIYRPFTWFRVSGPSPISTWIENYAKFFGDERRLWTSFKNQSHRPVESRSPIDYEFWYSTSR